MTSLYHENNKVTLAPITEDYEQKSPGKQWVLVTFEDGKRCWVVKEVLQERVE